MSPDGGQDQLAFNQFLTCLRQRWGLDWSDYRPDYLQRRIRICMAAVGLSTYAEYAGLLERETDALTRLRDTITVNVTEFFRDASTYQAFKALVIPEILDAKRKSGAGLIRVWSAGCASGEEPLSIALSFLEVLDADAEEAWVSVYGTDVDEAALDHARRGVYKERALAAVPPPTLEEHFRKHSNGEYATGETLRRLVRFQRLDLIHDEPLKHVDVIFCRYVFIYMSRSFQERILRTFHSSLNQRGFLVLGRTESMPVPLLEELYEWVSPEERIYRKRPTEVYG